LHKKNVEDEVVETVVERLTRAGLLDDREFARYWVENRLQFNPRGARALRQELRQRGVSTSIITDTLAGLSEEAAARKAASAGARRLAHLEPRDFRRRLWAYLARRGFSYTVIEVLVEEMLEAVCCEALSDIESEE
jgi:regulatory protein